MKNTLRYSWLLAWPPNVFHDKSKTLIEEFFSNALNKLYLIPANIRAHDYLFNWFQCRYNSRILSFFVIRSDKT